MEFAVAKALKPSLRREFIFQQALSEELLYLNGNTVVGGEDFSVDDLLDFSNGESLHYEQLQQQEKHDEEKSLSSSNSLSQDSNSNSTDISCDSIFTTELVVPVSLAAVRSSFLLIPKFKLRFLISNSTFVLRLVSWQSWSGFLTS